MRIHLQPDNIMDPKDFHLSIPRFNSFHKGTHIVRAEKSMDLSMVCIIDDMNGESSRHPNQVFCLLRFLPLPDINQSLSLQDE